MRKFDMSRNFARPLPNDREIEHFLENCLGVCASLQARDGTNIPRPKVARMLRDAEAAVGNVAGKATVMSEDCRDENYRSTFARRNLRIQIFEELCTLPRLDDDDQISLGHGGAKPQKTEPIANHNAYIVTGLPACGKSKLVNAIADQLGAMIVDSDYAKRKFPEYDCIAGAQLVHEESSLIVEGGNLNQYEEETPSLLGYCKKIGFNLVMPKIGHDQASLLDLNKALIASGYKVHLTTIVLSRDIAARQALNRFIETKRYVPVARAFDTYANDPALTYYRLRVDHLNSIADWKSFGALTPKNNGYVIVDCSSEDNPAAIFRSKTV